MVKIHAKHKNPAISIFFKMAELDKIFRILELINVAVFYW